MEGEKAERALQGEMMGGQIQKTKTKTKTKTKKRKEKKLPLDETPVTNAPISSVGSDNLPSFAAKLDQCEEEDLLTWQENDIPHDEIWKKWLEDMEVGVSS